MALLDYFKNLEPMTAWEEQDEEEALILLLAD